MILHYNSRTCTKEILSQPKFEKYRNDNFETLIDQYKKFELERIFPFIDRTGAIPNYLKTTIYTPMPKYDPDFNSTFEELCQKRISELFSTGKKINLFWSGGLDSTNLLALMLPHSKDVTVHLTYNSILESGYMFDSYVKPNFEYTVHTSTAFNEWKEDELFITGDPGNHLHTLPSIKSYEKFVPGIDDLFAKENIHILHEPYYKYIPEKKCEFYSPALERSPRKIETLEDFIWFNTFNFRWDESQFALALKLIERWKMPPKEYIKVINNVIGFYYTPYFQQWSIHRKEPQYDLYNIKKTIKLEMRKIMRKAFGPNGEDYINNKGILESPIGLYAPNYMFLDINKQVVYDEWKRRRFT
jgi:hypothetical protein